MSITVEQHADVTLALLSGRINHTGAAQFETDLMAVVETTAEESPNIVLDMRDVEYMSSVGLRVLMLASKAAKAQDKNVVVAGLQSTMREIFEISRFDLVFKTYATTEEALSDLSSQALTSFTT